MSNPWDEFSAGGDFVEFNNVGDSITGTIVNISAKRWDDGKVSPQLGLRQDDGTEVTLTAGWVMLVKELKEKAPNVGDRIKVTMTGKGPKPKETRSWSVEILGAAATPTATPAPPSAPAPVASAVAAGSPLDALTPEEKAALGIASAPAMVEDPRLAVWRAAGLNETQINTLLAA